MAQSRCLVNSRRWFDSDMGLQRKASMNHTRYIFDPGLPDETGFYYPDTWEPLTSWPSTLGKQAATWDEYLTEEDKGKKYRGAIIQDGRYFKIFVDSQEELLEYMEFHGIEVDNETEFCWNDGKVYHN